MGKASKWIINFLVGKQEKKIHQTNVSNEHSSIATATANKSAGNQAGTPRVKRRWSFGKLPGKEASHRFSKSVDSIDTTKLSLKAQQNHDHDHALALAVVSRDVENAAATRIQAAFRSHLARKALYALKGLVKLQALIRGHIVRKKTTATIMQMQALMAIQVRARFKRIQMAEEAQQPIKKQLSIHRGGFTQEDNGVHRKAMYLNPNDLQRVSKSISGHLSHAQAGRVEHGYSTIYSDRLSISNRHQFEESTFPIAHSPRNLAAASKPKPTRPPFSLPQQDYVDPACYDYTFKPNYMTNTKSSKAKVRSQSEPKQRPEGSMNNKTKQTELVDVTHVPMEDQFLKRSSSQFKPNSHKNHDTWFVKLYRSRRLFEDNKHALVSPSTGHSNYNESLAAYEPHVNLY